MLSRAEQDLLVTCARLIPTCEQVRQIRALLKESLRWDRILQEAWRHGVASFLHKNLKPLDLDKRVASEIRHSLFRLYHRAAYRNLHLLKALTEVLAAFDDARVPVIVLKGPSLVSYLYTEPALRPFWDLDLLIQRNHVSRARDLLLSSGYHVPSTLLSERLSQSFHFNVPFRKEGQVTILLELHWELTDAFKPFRVPVEDMWNRTRPMNLYGQPMSILSAEDLLIHLAVHLDMHGYLNQALASRNGDARGVFHPWSENRLIWYTDLYELMKQEGDQLDWAEVLGRAHEHGMSRAIGASLTLLNRLYGPVVDQQVIDELGPLRPSLPKRLLLPWVLSERTTQRAGDDCSKFWLRTSLLEVRQDVQFRLVRLLDLWDYVFPPWELVTRANRGASVPALIRAYIASVARAVATCGGGAGRVLSGMVRKWIACL